MKAGNKIMVLIALLIGVFLENLDHTVMATAIPSVVADLGGMDIFPWVFSVYLLTSTIFIPVFGKLADQYGKKPFLIIGFLTFIAASALSANAETMGQLIACRALQGLGAAPLMPIAFSLIFDLVKPEQQGKMQAAFAAVNGLSLLLGPIIGALVTEHWSWHWIFWMNVPLGIAALILVMVFYAETKERRKGSVDYAGAVLLAFAIAPLMLGLVMGGKNFAWGSWQIVGLFALSIIFSYLFVRMERKATEPIIDFQLFNRKVVSSTGIGFFQGLIMIAVMTYIPFYIQGVLGGSVTNVGMIVTHMIAAMIVGTAAGGHLLEKFPARTMLIGSVILIGIGSYMLTQIDAQTPDMYFFITMAVIGLGMGPLFPTTTLLAQTSVKHEQTTSVTSILSFFRNIGMAIGSNLLAVIVNYKLTKSAGIIIEQSGDLSPEQTSLLTDPNLLMDSALKPLVSEQALQILQDSLGAGIIQVFAVTVGAAFVMLAFSFLAGKERLVSSASGKKLGFH
ncbi:MFS transporter [Paenibacillus thermotolerans]|uniref:MFS transporter n=1 Tax=Paenibacillus thermotolerans TaxID=3027807 RepID=UPI00236856BE|nr:MULTISPECIES: MFS transporter [unclassified Paenibacillus]